MAEKNIELDSVEIAAAVFGNCDRNIRLLENEFSVTAVCRGTQLRLSGEPANVAAASRAVEGMLLLIENHTPLEDQTVRYCISLAHDGAEKRVRELTEDFVTVTVKGRPIRPKTLGQKEYLNAIRNNAITFGVGPAGTGKTFAARIIAAILDIDYFTVFELGTAFSMAGASGFWGLFESCRKMPMVIDDLGNESSVKSYSNVLPVRELLIARYELWQSLQCPTIITSNFASRKEISAAYGEFVTSRVLGMCDFVQFRGIQTHLDHDVQPRQIAVRHLLARPQRLPGDAVGDDLELLFQGFGNFFDKLLFLCGFHLVFPLFRSSSTEPWRGCDEGN